MGSQFQFRVMDSRMNPLPGAELRVNGVPAGFDTKQGLHIIPAVEQPAMDLEVCLKGFRKLDVKAIPVVQRPFDVFMRRKGDAWYYDVNRVPVAFTARPQDVMVVLKDVDEKGGRVDVEQAVQHLLSIKELAGFERIEVDWQAGIMKGWGRVSAKQILLRSPVDVPAHGSAALKALRGDGLVQYAGPLVVHGDHYATAKALGTQIHLEPAAGAESAFHNEVEKLGQKWKGRYDMQSHVMTFGPDAGMVVPEAQKDMVESGLFSVVEIDFYVQTVMDK